MRRWLLILAPIPTIAASIALTSWAKHDPHEGATRNTIRRTSGLSFDGQGDTASYVQPAVAFTDLSTAENLAVLVEEAADRLRQQLDQKCHVLVFGPLVLAGDLTVEELNDVYRETIQPSLAAMSDSYFRTAPNRPVTLLLFRNAKSYEHYAKQLFGQKNISIYGYYKPSSRTLVLNLGTGSGTLVHELTHAIIDFDFPNVPIWFNEGLASLHEQCRFIDQDGCRMIEGLPNWRLPILQETIQRGELPSLRKLTTTAEFLGRDEAINYAQARYLCMFLQRQGLLRTFYAQFREQQNTDPQGTHTLLGLFPDHNWSELDREFQQWALGLEK